MYEPANYTLSTKPETSGLHSARDELWNQEPLWLGSRFLITQGWGRTVSVFPSKVWGALGPA